MMHISREAGDLIEPPLHGNQGDRTPAAELKAPLGLTVAITREAGARGSSIARRLGKKLGWQVYTQELLEFLANNESARSHVLADMALDPADWTNAHLERLKREQIVKPGIELGELPRLILTLAARGKAILVGRGAGFLLPRDTTVHVRIIAPSEDRVAYMSQLLRRNREDASEQVREADEQRAEFLVHTFSRPSGDLYDYDMVLNSFLLGEEACADLVLSAVRGKELMLHPESDD